MQRYKQLSVEQQKKLEQKFIDYAKVFLESKF
jgi:hypothetical protein